MQPSGCLFFRQPDGGLFSREGPKGDVFRALADPSRRLLLDRLNERGGQSLRELCAGLGMARQSVSKHLAVLEEAGLVTTVRQGREKLHHLNPAPINDIAERWIRRYDQPRIDALADLKRALEDTDMDTETGTTDAGTTDTARPQFVHTSYIRTTPERLWQALTDPAFTRRYWGGTVIESDWKPGSPMVWEYKGVRIAHPEQVVLESDPYRRLSYTWHTFTPEFAKVAGFDEELRAGIAAEPRSRVTFELEQVGQTVKLTVVHGGFAPDSTVVRMVGEGWPRVVSDLKTLLETGETLPVD